MRISDTKCYKRIIPHILRWSWNSTFSAGVQNGSWDELECSIIETDNPLFLQIILSRQLLTMNIHLVSQECAICCQTLSSPQFNETRGGVCWSQYSQSPSFSFPPSERCSLSNTEVSQSVTVSELNWTRVANQTPVFQRNINIKWDTMNDNFIGGQFCKSWFSTSRKPQVVDYLVLWLWGERTRRTC